MKNQLGKHPVRNRPTGKIVEYGTPEAAQARRFVDEASNGEMVMRVACFSQQGDA
ncbi:MAG: hypothetical protein NZ520_08095 [bacterium]|nr:hypothetical protein [bacterium]MDW8105154.1 hypothetical protein [Armatimonadota bacterium]